MYANQNIKRQVHIKMQKLTIVHCVLFLFNTPYFCVGEKRTKGVERGWKQRQSETGKRVNRLFRSLPVII